MSEQLIATLDRTANAAAQAVATEAAGSSPVSAGASEESVREAMRCLNYSARRLRRGGAEQTDEVLDMLRAAAMHLQQSLGTGRESDPGAGRAE